MRVIFDHSEAETDSIRTFYFKVPTPLHYTAGQFIELTLPHTDPDDRGTKRWFTLSSAPTQTLLSITTKLREHDGSTFKKALRKLKAGDELDMSQPMGDFVLPKFIQTPLIFIAGGIGITPYHSMLQWLSDTDERRPITMIYGVHSEDEIIFQPIFDKAHQHVTIVVEEPSTFWGGEHGRLSAELIIGLKKPSEDALVYLSGPETMIEPITQALQTSGISKQQLVTDFFPGYLDI